MTIIGADLSRYDPLDAARQYPFVILNVEDPGMADKARFAHAAGVRIQLYSWVYPGDQGHSLTRSYAAEELLAAEGIHVDHHWLDYEQSGCMPQDLRNAGARVDARWAPVGTYTYLYLLPSVRDALVGPLWLAYYPTDSGAYWPAQSDAARGNGAVMHQFTSTGGTRDLNAVLDEDWFHSLSQGDNDMTPEQMEAFLFEPTEYGVSRFEVHMNKWADERLAPAKFFDKPMKLVDWITLNDTIQSSKLKDLVAEAVKASVPAGSDVDTKALTKAVLDGLHDRLVA